MTAAAPIHRYAKRLARDVARGHVPELTDEIADYLAGEPQGIFDSLDGVVDRLNADDDHALTSVYLVMLAKQLEFLRYRIDRGYQQAIDLQAAFEERVAGLARSGELPSEALSLVVSAMHHAKLAPGPGLMTVQAETLDLEGADLDADAGTDVDLGDLLSEAAAGCGGDAFALLEALREATHAMPAAVRPLLAEQMLTSPKAVVREAAALMPLDADPEARRAIGEALARNAAALTPTALRRLVAMQHWLPAEERPLIDRIMQGARDAALDCAPWKAGTAADLRASNIDGSGTQGVLLASPASGKFRLSSILFRFGVGIIDAWSQDPISKGELRRLHKAADAEAAMQPVRSGYVDRAVAHHLAAGLERGALPPLGLLQVAEAIHATHWRPLRLDWQAVLEALAAEVPAPWSEPDRVDFVVSGSAHWAAHDGYSDSWFEDDQEVVDLLAGPFPSDPEKATDQVLAAVIEPRRLKWAERFAWMALWLKDGAVRPDEPWALFTLLAREIVRGRPLASIPLMREIAEHTLAVIAVEDGSRSDVARALAG